MKLSNCCQLWFRWAAALAAVLLLVPGSPLTAKQKRLLHVVHRRTLHRRKGHPVGHRQYRRYDRYRRRYIRVDIPPERVQQIQQALIKAGMLHEKPSGRWDTATRDAMRRYQQENGFSPTGLPEAKPLMALGLGPHPLPLGLIPHPPAGPQGQGDTEASAASSSPSEGKASSSQ